MTGKRYIKDLALSALFIAIGLLLPVLFHSFGMGSTFLPMHIPVLIAGFVLSLPWAAAVGAVTPLLSSVITGMPPLFPIMPYMVCELAAYGAAANILSRRFKQNIAVSLIGSMIIGRIIAGLSVWVLVLLFQANLPGPVVFIWGAITTGLPGIIIQLLAIPPIVLILKKARYFK